MARTAVKLTVSLTGARQTYAAGTPYPCDESEAGRLLASGMATKLSDSEIEAVLEAEEVEDMSDDEIETQLDDLKQSLATDKQTTAKTGKTETTSATGNVKSPAQSSGAPAGKADNQKKGDDASKSDDQGDGADDATNKTDKKK